MDTLLEQYRRRGDWAEDDAYATSARGRYLRNTAHHDPLFTYKSGATPEIHTRAHDAAETYAQTQQFSNFHHLFNGYTQ